MDLINLLADFLDSVIFQKEGYVIEVIVINMTEDTSEEKIEALKPGLLKVISGIKGITALNMSAAYNYAASVASGEYLAFANYCAKFFGGDFFDWLVPFTFYPGSGLVSGAVEYRDRFNTVTLMGDKVGIGYPPEEIYMRTRRKPRIDFTTELSPLLVYARNETAVFDAFALIKKNNIRRSRRV